MKIYIASDHGGFEYKEELKTFLKNKGYEVGDMGANKLDPGDDYPDFTIPCAEKVSDDEGSFGIIIGRSGNGEQIAANKVKGIRAALCLDEKMAQKAREDNDANIVTLGADYLNLEFAKKIVETFLATAFSNAERHKRRIEKITAYEIA